MPADLTREAEAGIPTAVDHYIGPKSRPQNLPERAVQLGQLALRHTQLLANAADAVGDIRIHPAKRRPHSRTCQHRTLGSSTLPISRGGGRPGPMSKERALDGADLERDARLRALRGSRGWSHDKVARRGGFTSANGSGRIQVLKLESGHLKFTSAGQQSSSRSARAPPPRAPRARLRPRKRRASAGSTPRRRRATSRADAPGARAWRRIGRRPLPCPHPRSRPPHRSRRPRSGRGRHAGG